MKKNIFISILFCSLSISLFAQTKKDIHYISELKVINENLYPVLDSMINVKSKVPFYKQSTLFSIWLGGQWLGYEKYGFDSISVISDWISFHVERNGSFSANCDLGIFDYKGNTFFVRGDSLYTNIFSKEGRKGKVDFSKYTRKRKYDKKGNPIFYYDEFHKVYCSSIYRYKDNKFLLLQFSCFDDSVPAINNMDKEYPQK